MHRTRAQLEQDAQQSLDELRTANQRLKDEIAERRQIEDSLAQSERNLRLLFDRSPDAIFVEDADGRVLDANPAACRLHGLTREELVGRNVLDLIPPAQRHAVSKDFPKLLTGDLGSVDGYSLAADGTAIPVEIRASRIEYRGVPAVLLHVRDMSARLKTERALRESEERYRTLVDSAPIPILVVKSGFCAFANPAVARMLGVGSPSELIGRPVLDLIAPEFRDTILQRIAALDDRKANPPMEVRLLAKDGSKPIIESTSFAVQFDGEPAVLVIGYDLTEHKRTDEERRQLEAQVQHAQKLESLGVLAGGIAHDFNNILMAILGNADMALQDLPAASPARLCLTEIECASRRAAELCRQMLAYAGRGQFSREPLNLSELVEEMGHILDISISKKSILKYDFPPDVPPVEADASQIRQVVMNLIINASEALGEGEGIIALSTRVAYCDQVALRETFLGEGLPQGLYVLLEVSDSGCGMDPETQARVFDPFFSTKFAGRGLGLAAVLGIVRAHRGAIKVRTQPGHGSTFTVYLPAAEARIPSVDRRRERPPVEWRGEGTVLLVDDQSDVLRLGTRTLEALGYNVLTASDGREALKVFEAAGGNVVGVLLDLTMPSMDGAETLWHLRERRPDVKVVLASGYEERDVAKRFGDIRPTAFIQKPYTRDALRRILQRAFSRAGAA